MNNEFDSVDERIRTRFEEDWLRGEAGKLSEYLPEKSDGLYPGTLQELVHIELEFLWKQFDKDADGTRPKTVAGYLLEFPELNDGLILEGLIQAEFELRWHQQDQPAIPDYILQYGKGVDGQLDVSRLLEPLAKRLATSRRPARQNVSEGTRLGRYKLVAEHGRGGFSAVWRADDSKMGRRIALKKLGSNLARQSESRRRFVSEARVTARLEHPGIVPVYDMSNLDEEHAYYTMKLVRGNTMAEKIVAIHEMPPLDSQRIVEEKNLLRSFLDVCNTIDYCHARGVIHRDLKPQNVVVGNFGETIVLDWGLASVSLAENETVKKQWSDQHILTPEESVETLQGSVAGTPGYMPPEQAGSEFEQVGAHSDIYSLGAMLYHIIAGRTAFQGGRAMNEVLRDICDGQFPKPRSVSNSVPRPLEAICLKAMERLPEHRYETVKELSSDVQRYLADEPVTVCKESPRVRLKRWIRKNQTLATGMVLAGLFAILAMAAGWMNWQKQQKRELQRIADVRDAAEQSEAAGMLQLGQNEWESSLEFLEQALELVKDEPELGEIRDRLYPKATRLRSIVEAYEFADKAQHYLFDDHLSKAAIYAQAAVHRTGVLEHEDWWNHLAVDGMRPEQVQYLRDEVYRLMGMWCAMRFAETTPSSFSFDWFLSLAGAKQADPKHVLSCNSAKHAATIAQRYRPSTLMRLVTYGANLMLKEKDSFKFPVKGAENASDAAMLGSILDNNISDNKVVMRILLADKDPARAAETMLLDGIANIPDWYWLAIFVGENLQNEKRYQESIRMFSHAIGVNPDGWMAYSRRSSAYIQGSLAAESETEKNTFLKNALLDIQKAEALAPNEPVMLWDKGAIYSYVDGLEGVSDAYLHFLFNTPFLKDMVSQHRVQVVKDWQMPVMINQANVSDEYKYRNNPATRMGAAARLWDGDLEDARARIERALEYTPADLTSRMLQALIQIQEDPDDESAVEQLLETVEEGVPWWVGSHQLGIAYERMGDLESARWAFEQAVESAQLPWQTAETKLAQSRIALHAGNQKAATKLFRQAVDADLSVQLTQLENVLLSNPCETLEREVREHRKKVDPYFDVSTWKRPIQKPAMTNGGFELELSAGWGEAARNSPRVWEIVNQFWTVGIRVTNESHNGNASFMVYSVRPFEDDESYSLMPQTFPVTANQRYRVTVWAKAEDSENRTLGIYSDTTAKQSIVSIPGGDYDWQKFTGEFTASGPSATLVIACKGQGTVWIDDLSIEAVGE